MKKRWLAVATVAAVLIGSVVLALVVGVNQQVTPSTRPQNETTIGVFGTLGSRTAIGGANDYADVGGDNRAGCGVYRGIESGTDNWAWTTGFIPDTSAKAGGTFDVAGDPVVAVDGSGIFYYACLASDTTRPFRARITVSTSTNGGASWGSPVQVARGSGRLGPFPDKPSLAADQDNSNVYIAWTRFGGAVRAPIQFARSTDGGVTFSRARTFSLIGFSANQGSSIAEGTGTPGNVYVAFENFNTVPCCSFWLAKSTDDGATFSSLVEVADGGGPIVVHDIPSPLAGASFRVNSFPQLAVNRSNGDLYIVWAENVSSSNPAEIKFIRSTDGGATWSAPACVGDCATASAQFFPAISVAPNGSRIDVVYYGCVSAASSGACDNAEFNLRYVSWDGTTFVSGNPAFSSPVTVNSVGPIDGGVGFCGQFFGDYNGVASTNDRAYPLWTDTRNFSAGDPRICNPGMVPVDDNQDVYFAAITP